MFRAILRLENHLTGEGIIFRICIDVRCNCHESITIIRPIHSTFVLFLVFHFNFSVIHIRSVAIVFLKFVTTPIEADSTWTQTKCLQTNNWSRKVTLKQWARKDESKSWMKPALEPYDLTSISSSNSQRECSSRRYCYQYCTRQKPRMSSQVEVRWSTQVWSANPGLGGIDQHWLTWITTI